MCLSVVLLVLCLYLGRGSIGVADCLPGGWIVCRVESVVVFWVTLVKFMSFHHIYRAISVGGTMAPGFSTIAVSTL